jgi:hypothetical protein
VFGRPEYAAVQKELEAELTRLRKELRVPEQDPPETIIPRNPVKPKTKTKRN